MTSIHGAQTILHTHESESDCLTAAAARNPHTLIVIGAKRSDGVLMLDVDAASDVCADVEELRRHLLLIAEALSGS